jgi:aspartyl protease family protein
MQYLRAVLFFPLLFFIMPAWSGVIYKCKNPQGRLLYQERPCTQESKSVSSWGSASGAPLVMVQDNNGHYFVDGTINEHKLNFVIDTGASLVSIPQGLANSAGLSCQRRVTMRTGNGEVNVCTTIIQLLKFGSFALQNVEAVIAPNLDQPLLGMNVIKQFRVEQDSGEMRLSTKN